MKIGELITRLQDILDTEGDLDIHVEQTNDCGPELASDVQHDDGLIVIVGDPFR